MLLNPPQSLAFSPGSLLTCCFGISDGASQAPGGCVCCLLWGHKLVRGSWTAVVAVCENRKPPRCFFPPCLFLPSPSWCEEFGKEALHPEMWRVCESSHGEAGQQVTGLPVGAGCTGALLLPLVVSWQHAAGISAQSSEGETYPLSSVWSETPSPIFLFSVMWMKCEFGDIVTTWLTAQWPSID